MSGTWFFRSVCVLEKFARKVKMAIEDPEKLVEELENKSLDELKRKRGEDIITYEKRQLYDYVIKKKETEERKKEFDEMLGATKSNVDSTNRLVKATWALFGATVLIAIFTLWSILRH